MFFSIASVRSSWLISCFVTVADDRSRDARNEDVGHHGEAVKARWVAGALVMLAAPPLVGSEQPAGADTHVAAQAGPVSPPIGVVERSTIESSALHATITYRTLVTARPVPGTPLDLILLLHGANADGDQWDDVGIDEALMARQASGHLRPTLLVVPDGDSVMTASPGLEPPFERFLLRELLPAVALEHPLATSRAHRSIGGISRGGQWALLIAASHPDLFAKVGGHSAVVPTGSAAATIARTFAEHHVRVWLDVGASDALAPGTRRFATALHAAGVVGTFAQHPGHHDRPYWRSQVASYAAFYSKAVAA